MTLFCICSNSNRFTKVSLILDLNEIVFFMEDFMQMDACYLNMYCFCSINDWSCVPITSNWWDALPITIVTLHSLQIHHINKNIWINYNRLVLTYLGQHIVQLTTRKYNFFPSFLKQDYNVLICYVFLLFLITFKIIEHLNCNLSSSL